MKKETTMAKVNRSDERAAQKRSIQERMSRQERALDAMNGCVSALQRTEGLLREAGTQGSAQRANETVIARASIQRTIEGLKREIDIGRGEIAHIDAQGPGE